MAAGRRGRGRRHHARYNQPVARGKGQGEGQQDDGVTSAVNMERMVATSRVYDTPTWKSP